MIKIEKQSLMLNVITIDMATSLQFHTDIVQDLENPQY